MLRRRTILASLAVVAFLITAQPALALTNAPDVTWRTNGKVYALAISGDTIYFGGKFTAIKSPTGETRTANNLAAFDMSTGEPVDGFDASVTFSTTAVPWVRALAVSNDGSTLYVGGKFDTVGGEPHLNLAAVSTADGSVISSFTTTTNKVTNAILTGPDRIYLGGDFRRVNGKPRSFLAAIAPDGTLDDVWRPTAGDTIRSLTMSADLATVFIGGKFQTMDGQPRMAVARVDANTGALHPWTIPPGVIDTGNIAWDLLATPTRLFGAFGNGPNYTSAFRLDLGNVGSQVWKFNLVGNAQGLAFNADGSRLFVAGHFGTARLQQTVCGGTINLRGLMMVNPATGAIDCSWVPQIVPFGSNFVGAWAIESTSTQLWVGGYFNSISGVSQKGIARYTL